MSRLFKWRADLNRLVQCVPSVPRFVTFVTSLETVKLFCQRVMVFGLLIILRSATYLQKPSKTNN